MIRRVAPTFLALALVRGFAILGPLIVMPYLVKTVGLEGWGKISFAIAVTSFGGAVVQYGFSVSATARIARVRGDREQLQRYWRAHFGSSLALAVAVGIAGFLAIAAFESGAEMRLLMAGGLIFSLAISLVPIWLFMGLERVRPVIISNLLNQVGYVALVFLLVRGPGELRWVTLLGACAATAGLLVSLVEVRRQFGLRVPLRTRLGEVRATLRDGFPVFLMMFVPLLYNAGAIFVLGVTADKAQVGLFAIAATFVEAAILGGRLLANAALAPVASDGARYRKFAAYSMAIGIAAGLAMAAVSPIVADWLAPEHAAQVSMLMVILALSIPFAFAQLVFGQNYLAINGHAPLVTRIVITCSLIGGVLTLAVVPFAGAVGAAAVMLVSRALLGGASLFAYWRLGSGGVRGLPASGA